MCGIAGILDFGASPDRAAVSSMVSAMIHRGPDSDGFHVDGPIAMGMRRLSIIDLAHGDQPIFNEDRSIAVVFNGEIYNYVELREKLVQQGHRFSTSGDTEVLVHLYEDLGPRLLAHLNGMFAFAIWDARHAKLFLARDRMGVKPLYVARNAGRTVFASELKALVAGGCVGDQLDQDSIADYLRVGYIPREGTPYRSVSKMLPGHYMTVNASGATSVRWWDLAREAAEAGADRLPMEPDLVRETLEDSVRLRMRSDVPVASFLSGGLDSGIISMLSSRRSPMPMRTFHVRFENSLFDESEFARELSRSCGSQHQETHAGVEDALALLPRLMWYMDEPMMDSAVISSYLVSRLAASSVKVSLSGLGGDELFGGYHRYIDPGPGRLARLTQILPRTMSAIAPIFGRVRPDWEDEVEAALRPAAGWRKYLASIRIAGAANLHAMGFQSSGRLEEALDEIWRSFPGDDFVAHRQFVDQQTYLPDQILALTDRMSMAVSLEVRVPFLDYRLVRLSYAIPREEKQQGDRYKIILKKAFANEIPPSLLTRQKTGFDAPVARWLHDPRFRRVLRLVPAALDGVVDSGYVTRLLANETALVAMRHHAWSLLSLAVWLRVRRMGHPPEEGVEECLT